MGTQVAEVNKSIGWIRQAVSIGVPIGDAVRLAVGGNIADWAKAHGLNRSQASSTIWSAKSPVRAVVAALAEDLGCAESEILELLGEGAKLRAMAVAS